MKKNKTKLSTAILIGSAVIGSTNCDAQVEKDSLVNLKIIKDSVELEKRLLILSKTKTIYESETFIGATCYFIVPESYTKVHIIKKEKYICPKCGITTIRKDEYLETIKRIRLIVSQIKSYGLDVQLDESEFCNNCSETCIQDPSLIFKIRFSEDSKYHIAWSNKIDDYYKILELIQDKINNEEYETSIIDAIITINKMTGLGKKIIDNKHFVFDNSDREEYIKLLKESNFSDEEIEKVLKDEDEKE